MLNIECLKTTNAKKGNLISSNVELLFIRPTVGLLAGKTDF